MVVQININQFNQAEINLAVSIFFKAFYFEPNLDRHSIEVRKKSLEAFIQSINTLLANRLVEDETERHNLIKLLGKLEIQKAAFDYLLMSDEERENLKITARNFARKTRDPIGLP